MIISHLSNVRADISVYFLLFFHGCKMVPELGRMCVQGRKEVGRRHHPRLLLCRHGRCCLRSHHKPSQGPQAKRGHMGMLPGERLGR